MAHHTYNLNHMMCLLCDNVRRWGFILEYVRVVQLPGHISWILQEHVRCYLSYIISELPVVLRCHAFFGFSEFDLNVCKVPEQV